MGRKDGWARATEEAEEKRCDMQGGIDPAATGGKGETRAEKGSLSRYRLAQGLQNTYNLIDVRT